MRATLIAAIWALMLLMIAPAIAGVLLPFGVDARRGTRAIVVRDYTSAAWSGTVAQAVVDFNAVMPESAPPLKYRRMAKNTECKRIPREYAESFVVCARSARNPFTAARTYPMKGSGLRIELSRATPPNANVICHEMMHALTGVPDNYGALPDESCVHGSLAYPGPFDIQLLEQTFGKHRGGKKR